MSCLFLHFQHRTGLRGKAATAALAGLRLYFAKSLQSTTFPRRRRHNYSESGFSTHPRGAPHKEKQRCADSVKLPDCEDMLVSIRAGLWTGQALTGQGLVNRMTYFGFGFDQGGRISQYTAAEPNHEDHCVRVDALPFNSGARTTSSRDP
jgi:hypothetical protein